MCSLPRRNLGGAVTKFAAGNLGGYKAAQPAPRVVVNPARPTSPDAPACAEIAVSDDFNRADGLLGANWSPQFGSTDVQIVGGTAKLILGSLNYLAWNTYTTELGGEDITASVTVAETTAKPPTVSGDQIDLGIRVNPSGFGIHALLYNNFGSPDEAFFQLTVSGPFGSSGTDITDLGPSIFTLSPGDLVTAQVCDDFVIASVNGTVRATGTAFGETGLDKFAGFGLRQFYNVGGVVDDIAIDNFTAQNVCFC